MNRDKLRAIVNGLLIKEQRQSMRNAGLKIYVDGKIFREKVNDHDSR